MADRMTPAMETALRQQGVLIFVCGQAELPGYNLRLLDGAGEVTWGGVTFRSKDERFGILGGIDAITDGIGDQAPQVSVTFLPPSETAAADLAHPSQQSSRIRLWIGAIDPATRAVIAEPYILFDGELDQPTLTIDKGHREVEFDCVSSFEKLFRDEEGVRLSDTHHQEIWPGEQGLSDVTGIVKQIIWGPGDKIAGSFYSSGSGGSGGSFSGRDDYL